jgi:uncharacterized membrane protein
MIPFWYALALVIPMLWALTYHIDKVAMTRYGAGVSYMHIAILSGINSFVPLLILLPLHWTKLETVSIVSLTSGLLAGAAYFLGLYFYYAGLGREEVTRVAPLYALSPVLGVILGVFLLNETFTTQQIAGVMLIVFGGLLIDTRRVKNAFTVNWRAAALIIASGISFLMGSIGFKYSADSNDFWATLILFFLGALTVSTLTGLLPAHRNGLKKLYNSKKRRIFVLIMLGSSCIGVTGRILHNYSILLVPIAFVQAVEQLEAVFVLIIAVIISRLFKNLEPDNLTKKVLIQKVLSVLVITAGSLLII